MIKENNKINDAKKFEQKKNSKRRTKSETYHKKIRKIDENERKKL